LQCVGNVGNIRSGNTLRSLLAGSHIRDVYYFVNCIEKWASSWNTLLFRNFVRIPDDGRVSRPKHFVVNIMNIRYYTNSVVSLIHCNDSDRTGNTTGFLYFNVQAYLTSQDYMKLLYGKAASIFKSNLVFFHHNMFSFT